jgi:glutathione S-transferase
MSRILHAALPDDWAAARRSGRYAVSTRGRSLADEGFIHASTLAQLHGVLDAFYTDLEALVLLVLDVDALAAAGSPVRWEPVPGQPSPFPHIYGPVPTSLAGVANPVVGTLPLHREPGAAWRLPDLSTYDLATDRP